VGRRKRQRERKRERETKRAREQGENLHSCITAELSRLSRLSLVKESKGIFHPCDLLSQKETLP